MLVSLSKAIALSELMLNVKRDSSKWVKESAHGSPSFAWQEGYFAFSIGASGTDALIAYIAKDRIHHASIDFKDEMRSLFRKYGIEYDEHYVWE